jgi:hypothetical protein
VGTHKRYHCLGYVTGIWNTEEDIRILHSSKNHILGLDDESKLSKVTNNTFLFKKKEKKKRKNKPATDKVHRTRKEERKRKKFMLHMKLRPEIHRGAPPHKEEHLRDSLQLTLTLREAGGGLSEAGGVSGMKLRIEIRSSD